MVTAWRSGEVTAAQRLAVAVAAVLWLPSAALGLAAVARRLASSMDSCAHQWSGERWWHGGGFRQPKGVGFIKLVPPELEIFMAHAWVYIGAD